MECKGTIFSVILPPYVIGIYPEWNVKIPGTTEPTIEPNWNISRMECKGYRCKKSVDSFRNWNISRMECKGYAWPKRQTPATIGIYPEWNVKLNEEIEVNLIDELEYIQNGM